MNGHCDLAQLLAMLDHRITLKSAKDYHTLRSLTLPHWSILNSDSSKITHFTAKKWSDEPHTGNNFIQNQPLCKTLTNQDGQHQHICSHAANMRPISLIYVRRQEPKAYIQDTCHALTSYFSTHDIDYLRFHLSTQDYHLVRAPLSFLHCAARSFWFRHSPRPCARQCEFRWSTARRRRRTKASRVSRPDGSLSSRYNFNFRHQPSMAFMSGELFGYLATWSQPARVSAAIVSGARRNFS